MSSIKMPSPKEEVNHSTRIHHIGYFILMTFAVIVGVFVHPMMGFAVIFFSMLISKLFREISGSIDTLDGDQDGN